MVVQKERIKELQASFEILKQVSIALPIALAGLACLWNAPSELQVNFTGCAWVGILFTVLLLAHLRKRITGTSAMSARVAGALKEGKLDEAVKVADRNKKSHLAEVVTAGLQEFRNYGGGGAITEEQIESSKRALERSEAIVHAKLKRGLGGLATIGSTAPFIGLFGTVVGILNAFQQIATQKTSGIGAVAGGISEALVTTAFGLLVAIPAVMTFNYFTGKVEAFDVEMDNSSSELIDYFIKQSHRR